VIALGRISAASGSAVSAGRIAKEYGLPAPLLRNVLKDLQRAGVVRSVRGVAGGYVVNADLSSVSLLDVVMALEDGMHRYEQGLPRTRHGENVPKAITMLRERLLDFARTVSVRQLIGQSRWHGAMRRADAAHD